MSYEKFYNIIGIMLYFFCLKTANCLLHLYLLYVILGI